MVTFGQSGIALATISEYGVFRGIVGQAFQRKVSGDGKTAQKQENPVISDRVHF